MQTWIDEAVMAAMERYLKTCGVGGMPPDHIEAFSNMVNHAAGLGVFSMAVAEGMSTNFQRFASTVNEPQ